MGTNTQNIIDINGKRYDAVTGSYIGTSAQAKQAGSYGITTGRTAHPGSIDGFRRVSRSEVTVLKPIPALRKPVIKTVAAPAASPEQFISPVAAVAARKPHSPGAHVAPHIPQRATTLMRSAVKKPVIQSPSVIKANTRTDLLANAPMQTVAPKISYNAVNHVRHQRAERMIKSPSVTRYSRGTQSVTVEQYEIAPLPATVSRPAPRYKAAAGTVTAGSLSEIRTTPAASAQKSAPAYSRAPSVRSHAPAAALSEPDIFELALAGARSHEETYEPAKHRTKKRRGRVLRVISGTTVALFLLGFLAFQNTPALSLKVASYKAGLHASMPSHQPSGFKFGYLNYEPGNVTVNFTSPADSRQFNITQKASDWDSQALLNNFVSTASSAYKTYQRAGRTVYLVGNNTATWVDSGIWYTVDGNASLTSAQLLDVAGSM